MRTIYLGTSDFAAAVLARLAASAHRPALVVSRPDRPRGRGRKLASPPVVERARELEIEVFQPESVNTDEALDRISTLDPETLCVCAFGSLIKQPLLSRYELLNVHPSLLPRWRGAAPVERAIMAGDQETGVSIMRLVEELDAGPVCLQRVEPIEPEDTYGSLAERLEQLGGELLVEALDSSPEFVEQSADGVTYAEKITAADRRLDPAHPAAELALAVRALTPHIGALLELPGGELLGIRAARVCDESSSVGKLGESEGRLLLGCADQALELITVQPAGGRPMSATEYLRGHGIQSAQ